MRVFAEIGGAEIVGPKIGQLAFQAFEVEPKRATMAEQQDCAPAWRFGGVELDCQQLERSIRAPEVDVARFTRQHPVEAQRRDQTARGGLAGQTLFPIET